MKARNSGCGTTNVRVLVAATLMCLVVPLASVQATQIWLYPDDDDPREGGHVVDQPTFTLVVENRGGGPGDGLAEDMQLVVAIADPALLASITLDVEGDVEQLAAGDFADGIPILPCSGRGMPPHSWYPTPYALVSLGDLDDGDTVSIDVTIDGADGLEMHFDAIGFGTKGEGDKEKCFDIVNPSGHDVSVILGGDDDDDDGDGEDDCPEISVSKSASVTGVDVGGNVDYLIEIGNEGSCDLTGLVIHEDLPMIVDDAGNELAAFTVLGAEPPPTTWADDELIWDVDLLAAGGVLTVTVSAVFDQEAADGTQVVNTVCVEAAELEEAECDRAKVAVGGIEEDFGGPGFWCNQIRFTEEGRRNAKFTEEELAAWLLKIGEESTVFSELWMADTTEDASIILCEPNDNEGAADRLVRHLLSLWLNIASERLLPVTTLGELCDGEQEAPEGIDPAMTIGALVAAVEADLVAGADDDVLGWWQEIVDWINSTHLCQGQPRRMGGRR